MKIKHLLLLSILLSMGTFSWGQYMLITAEGEKQGKFKGESNRSGATGKTEVLSFMYEVKSPRDAATGQSTGKRQHQPITLWKVSGSSSPQFFTAIATNEKIRTLVIEFYKPDEVFGSGLVQLYYKIELTNVSVSGYKQVMGVPEMEGFKAPSSTTNLYDEIKLVFEKITVTAVKGSTTAADDWNSRTQ